MFIGYGFPQKTLEVLAKYHAKSLHHLRFRYELISDLGRAKRSENKRTPSVSIHDLVNLANQLPNLLSLGINLSWTPDEELPYDILASIVQHTHLRHLELNIPKLHHDSPSWPYPNFNESTCRALVEFFDQASLNLLSFHFVIGDWFPFRLPPVLKWYMEAFLVGERDYTGHMRFSNVRNYLQHGKLMRSGTFVPRVPLHQLKGHWPVDLRQDIEGRIGDHFGGKMMRK
ncbi:unnamed protein product [Penicillium bialowiezense]